MRACVCVGLIWGKQNNIIILSYIYAKCFRSSGCVQSDSIYVSSNNMWLII